MISPDLSGRSRRRVKLGCAIAVLAFASALTFAAIIVLAVSLVGIGMQTVQYSAAQEKAAAALAGYLTLQDHYQEETARYNADKERLEAEGYADHGSWSPSGDYIEGLFFRFPDDPNPSDCPANRWCVIAEIASNSFISCPTGIEVIYKAEEGRLFSGSSGYGISSDGSARVIAYAPEHSLDVRLEKIICS